MGSDQGGVRGRGLTAALSILMFLSGAAALLFETLWFRLAGLAFGNTVWASSLVLASFMAGLALGNGLAARYAPALRRPVRVYGVLEAVIGLAGLALVLGFPPLTSALAPVFRRLLEDTWALNGARLLAAFALMLLPATAMGATLPVLVRALHEPGTGEHGRTFGRLLGLLYGMNTLGAVAGALAGEAALIGWLGLRGTGVAAAALNGVASASALALAVRLPAAAEPARADTGPLPVRLLAAAFLCGGALLALEVVWFRFLLLFVHGSSLAFGVMLSVVLLGIAGGGLLASAWQRRQRLVHRHLSALALAAGAACVATYAAFTLALRPYARQYIFEAPVVFGLSLCLMFPVCLVSGVLFALLGAALEDARPGGSRTAGALTLANTVGAATGSVLAGFVLLPRLGVERSLFLLAAAYGVVAWLVRGPSGEARAVERWTLRAALAGLALALVLFPFGLMERSYLTLPVARFSAGGARTLAVREGLTETLLYLRKEMWGEPHHHLLVTNGFSMASSAFGGRRYMKLFVYWPLAVRPEPKSALLISYGLGVTARALADAPSLRTIDVVDISRDVLEMGRLVYPPPERHPLDDRRVRIHVEDGRFFLLTTARRFDLITAEPPPPKTAGVVNLYSREYFQLVHDRLEERGVATYWLPVHQLELAETKSVIRGFCDVFRDCSLWQGMGTHWMLAGTRGLREPAGPAEFARAWDDAVLGPDLRGLGFETPASLGTAFLADAPFLDELTRGEPPLEDDWPHRVSARVPARGDPAYVRLMDPDQARQRFAASAAMAALWPPALRETTLTAFEDQRLVHGSLLCLAGASGPSRFSWLEQVLTRSRLRTIVLLLMDSDDQAQRLAERARGRGVRDRDLDYELAVGAMADRDYGRAEAHLQASQPGPPGADAVTYYRILAAHLAGDRIRARALADAAKQRLDALRAAGGLVPPDAGFWAWWDALPR